MTFCRKEHLETENLESKEVVNRIECSIQGLLQDV